MSANNSPPFVNMCLNACPVIDMTLSTVPTTIVPLTPNPLSLYEKVTNVIENVTTLFREEDKSVLDLIFKCRGAVYGGYLRDIISKTVPKDIDIVVSETYKSEFETGMATLGYEMSYNDANETDVYTKAGALDIEVYYLPDEPDDISMGPVADPDFSVNLLSYVDGRLHVWIGEGFKDLSLVDVIEDIILKETTQLSPNASEERIQKIQDKGYKIIGQRNLDKEGR